MKERFSLQDLKSAGELLEQLIEEVKTEESTLSGGTKLGPGTEALQSLKETRVSFGNPYHNLARLTPQKLQECGLELSSIQMQRMNERYDFYYMTLSVSMQPGPGVQFTRLECHLDFGPKGSSEPIVHSIFPRSEWREVLRLGRKMDVGLDSSLQWTAAVETPDAEAMDALPAVLKGKVAGKNELKAYVTVPEYSYKLGRTEIAAYGEGNSECFWRIDKPELKKAQTVQLGVVFKVPKGTSSFKLRALAAVEPAFQWLTSNLGDMFEFLSEKIKKLLKMKDEKRKGKNCLRVGDHEEWLLELPKE